MARHDLKRPLDALFEEKNLLDKKLTEIGDLYVLRETELRSLRNEQFSYREAKQSLSNNNTTKPARAVFDRKISECQALIETKQKQLEEVEKDRIVWSSRSKALQSSIRELQNA